MQPRRFDALPNVWYHLKTRVDVAADGSGVIRAKVWKKGDPEPDKWTIEVPHKHAHRKRFAGPVRLCAAKARLY